MILGLVRHITKWHSASSDGTVLLQTGHFMSEIRSTWLTERGLNGSSWNFHWSFPHLSSHVTFYTLSYKQLDSDQSVDDFQHFFARYTPNAILATYKQFWTLQGVQCLSRSAPPDLSLTLPPWLFGRFWQISLTKTNIFLNLKNLKSWLSVKIEQICF